jgi:uncharacterized protein
MARGQPLSNASTSVASPRLELLDSVRGFALMGLFLVHSVEQFEAFWAHPDFGAVYQWDFGLFSGKAYALMALCFGVSFYLIMEGAARRGHDFRWRFAWRLTILFAIGLLHTIFYRGDILQMLALFGFSMLLLDRIRSNRVLLVLAAVCFLETPLLFRAWLAAKGIGWAAAQPFYFSDPGMAALIHGTFLDVVRANFRAIVPMNWSYAVESGRLIQMLGLFIVGLVLARVGFFTDPDRFKLQRRAMLAAAILLAVPLYFYGSATVNSLVPDGPVRLNLGAVVDKWTALAIAVAELLLFVELFQSAARPLARVFAIPGRMTLTLYVGQSIVFCPIYYGYGLGLNAVLTPGQSLAIGAVAVVAQGILAHLWFRRFHYGPLEWLWRAATRTSLDVPFLKTPAPAPA